jgi:hypothetical protein
MDTLKEIGHNVIVMVGSVVLAVVVMILIIIGLVYLLKSQLTPAKISNFFFG